MNSNNQEIEAALIIYSVEPNDFIKEITNLESLSDFWLIPEKSVVIHDIYFDTPTQELKSKNLALRVRDVNDSCLITLKGNARSTDWGGVERLEIEMPWSIEALTKISNELNARKINLLKNDQPVDTGNPINVLMNLGLQIIQDRRNHRRIRNIVKELGSREVVAELVIDSVTFQFGDQEILFHEVEIESKISDGTSVIESFVHNLIEKYEPMLRQWPHSKLVTGKTIEKLFYEGALAGYVDEENNLVPHAFDKIDEYIKYGNI